MFFKFYNYVNEQLCLKKMGQSSPISFNKITNIYKYAQYCHIIPNSQKPHDAVGRPLVHKSAIQQTTGNFCIYI